MSALDEWRRLAPPPRPPRDGRRWDVFLSYRSTNRAWVINLYDVLREHGHEVFLDQVVLRPGDKLVGALQKSLDASRAGVLVWSNAAADSEWVENEYGVMLQRASNDPDFHFVPIVLDDKQLDAFLATRIYLSFKDYPDGPNGGELLRLLHAVVGAPMTPEAAHFAAEHEQLSMTAQRQVAAAIDIGNARALREFFDRGGLAWETSAVLACRVAEGLTRLGLPSDALEVLDDSRSRFPGAIRPAQLYALALMRRDEGDDLEQAQQILGELYTSGQRDPETVGLYGASWTKRFDGSQNRLHLIRARNLYAEAFAGAADDSYTGINAASKSLLLDDRDMAARHASAVAEIVGTTPTPEDYWRTATAAEAQLLMGNTDAATALYAAAVADAPEELGSHGSTWTQLCRLLPHLEVPGERETELRAVFAHLDDPGDAAGDRGRSDRGG